MTYHWCPPTAMQTAISKSIYEHNSYAMFVRMQSHHHMAIIPSTFNSPLCCIFFFTPPDVMHTGRKDNKFLCVCVSNMIKENSSARTKF